MKLLGAILICALLFLSFNVRDYEWSWWYIIMMFGAAYQAYEWFSGYVKSGLPY